MTSLTNWAFDIFMQQITLYGHLKILTLSSSGNIIVLIYFYYSLYAFTLITHLGQA